METKQIRQTDLVAFANARAEFTAAIASVPDEALGYLKVGDDYALGGLVLHVNGVLEHYRGVLDAIREADFEETSVADPPGLMETANAQARDGLRPEDRSEAMDRMDRLHAAVVGSLESVGEADWHRKAPVRYEAQSDPYPTSPADVTGWLTDHYLEHVPHAQQLLAAWRAGR